MLLKRYNLIFRQFSLTTINSVLFSLAQIIVQIIVVRNVSLIEYGIFSFTFSIYVIFEILITGYSSDHSIKVISNSSVRIKLKDQITEIGQLIRHDVKVFIRGIFISFFLGLFFYLNDNFSIQYYTLLLLGLFFNIGFSALKNSLISYNLIEIQTRFELKTIIIQFIICSLFSYFWGIIGYLISIPINNLIRMFIGFHVFENLGLSFTEILKHAKTEKKQEYEKIFILYSLMRNGLSNLYNQLDILLLGFGAFPSHLIAQYKVAKTLSGLPTRIVYPIWAALRGRIVEAHYSKNFNKLLQLIIKPTLVFSFIFCCIFLISKYYVKDFIILVYGKDYQDSTIIFLPLLIGTLLLQLTNSWFNFWVIISDKSKILIYILFIQILFLSLSIFLVNSEIYCFVYIVVGSMIIGFILQAIYFLSYVKSKLK